MSEFKIYLNFAGNCEEAFSFYRSVFGTNPASLNRYSELPPNGGMPVPEAYKDKILHIALPLNEHFTLMGSDYVEGLGAPLVTGNNFSVFINLQSTEDAEKYFTRLSENGKIVMPMGYTFWGSYFGMLTDRFGINWMISFEKPMD